MDLKIQVWIEYCIQVSGLVLILITTLGATVASNPVNNLLQTAGNLGKAVGVLVHVMTDDETGSDNEISVKKSTNSKHKQ